MSKIDKNDHASTTISLPFLPPELWVQITAQVPSAGTLASLAQVNRALHGFVENEGWKTFSRVRFPSLYASVSQRFNGPSKGHASTGEGRRLARTLMTGSRAWDRRALVAQSIAVPSTDFGLDGDVKKTASKPRVRIFSEGSQNVNSQQGPGNPSRRKQQKQQKQTMGFVPRVDVRETGAFGGQRTEILAWSTGTAVCLRARRRKDSGGSYQEDVAIWTPNDAKDGRDDITALHLLGDDYWNTGGIESDELVVGTANGDLRLIEMPRTGSTGGKASTTAFSTSNLPVRSSSLHHNQDGSALLAIGLGDSQIALYNPNSSSADGRIDPLDQIDVSNSGNSSSIVHGLSSLNISSSKRIWHTAFLSPTVLALGMGPSHSPIEIYTIQNDRLLQSPLRTFQISRDKEDTKLDTPHPQANGTSKPFLSSIYTIIPLPGSSASSADLGGNSNGDVFLSGAYDGLIRLHDLRSNRDHEQMISDAAGGGGNDSPIYSLLARGRERLLAGTGRHNLLKIFDLRMGARCYDYLDAQPHQDDHIESKSAAHGTNGSSGGSFNLFLREHSGGPAAQSSSNSSNMHRSGGRQPRQRAAIDSSVYTLAAASACSPYIYAGVENQLISLALHAVADIHPDTAYFEDPRVSREDLWWCGAVDGLGSSSSGNGTGPDEQQGQESGILNLSMYEQDLGMKLCVQRSVGDARRVQAVALANPIAFGETDKGDASSARAGGKDGWLAGRTVFGGLDERWMDAADADGGRWQRGVAQ